jgi:hypothetical protein
LTDRFTIGIDVPTTVQQENAVTRQDSSRNHRL